MKKFYTLLLIVFSMQLINAQNIYEVSPEVNNCKEGSLTQQEKLRVLDLVNRIRSSHNIPPVTYDFEGDKFAQKGALVTVANQALSHQPPSNWSCFSQDAYYGNEKSNLFISSGSGGSLPDSEYGLISWMIDFSVETLGHRRAIMNPFVDKISFGRVDKSEQGLRVTGMNLKYLDNLNANISSKNIEYVAYPQGDYDKNYFQNGWYLSFNVIKDKVNWWNNNGIDYSAAVITMKDSKGTNIGVNSIGSDNDGWGGLPNMIRWKCGNLVNYEEYTVDIKGVKFGGQTKDYSYKFTLGNGPTGNIPKPLLIKPDNNAIDIALNNKFEWQENADYSYNIQISESNDFKVILDESTISVNSFVSSKLVNKKTYYWRVRSKKDDNFSDWTEVRTFTTEEYSPAIPEIDYPLDQTLTKRIKPIFKWEKVNDNLKYHIQVADRETFSFKLIDKDDISENEYDAINDNLKSEKEYFWRLRSKDGNQYGKWSEIMSFTTSGMPGKVTLISPIDEEVLDIALDWNFVWNNDNNATDYEIKFYKYDNKTKEIIDSILFISNDTTFVFEKENDERQNVIQWKVTSLNSGFKGEESEKWNFSSALVGVETKIIKNELSAYPNPMQNFISIETKDARFLNQKYKIYNISGEAILEGKLLNSNERIDISTFTNGTYLFVINIENSNYLLKLIKE